MRFWDSSAIVPLIVDEPGSRNMRALLADDRGILVWRLAGTEIVSALWRRARAGELNEASRLAAERALGELERGWTSVEDLAHTDRRARRLLALHPLRAADCLHLAAALLACEERPQLLPFVTLDSRLGDAARREGFTVLG